jgi:lipoprotein-anchoring transpeptidase ErfK/SrfK
MAKVPVLAASVLVLAGCLAGCTGQQVFLPGETHAGRSCEAGSVQQLVTAKTAFAAAAPRGAVAYSRPGGAAVERFASLNVNDYPTVFEALARRVDARCRATWYRVQLPIKPNGVTGWVRAHDVKLSPVRTRIVVDLSRRTLTLYRSGRVLLRTTVAVGSSATPTPTGRYYVNQKLIPADASGPYGPAALGVSAYSTVLTGWVQGGPIGIHGTNEPWSIGRAVSNGCIRVPNATLERVFRLAAAGTPVTINA